MRRSLVLLLLLSLAGQADRIQTMRRCFVALHSPSLSSPVTKSDFSAAPFIYGGGTFNLAPEVVPIARQLVRNTYVPREMKERYLEILSAMYDIPGAHPQSGDHVPTFEETSLNQAFRAAQPDLVARLNQANDVMIHTHQPEAWQTPLASAVANDPLLKDVPQMILASPDYPLASRAFAGPGQLVQHGAGDGVSWLPSKANRFHLTGGSCETCLAGTIQDIIAQRGGRASDTPLDLFIYSKWSYDMEGSLASLIADGLSPRASAKNILSAGFGVGQKGGDLERYAPTELGNLGSLKITSAKKTHTDFGDGFEYTVQHPGMSHRPIRIFVLAK